MEIIRDGFFFSSFFLPLPSVPKSTMFGLKLVKYIEVVKMGSIGLRWKKNM